MTGLEEAGEAWSSERRPAAEAREKEATSRCFPFSPFLWCPAKVQFLMPATWQKIQDWTHLTLIVAVVASIVLVAVEAPAIWTGQCWTTAQCLCARKLLALVFSLPVTLYCCRIIQQYDDKLHAKQRQAKMEKENLTKSYHELLTDMDGLLTKSAESASGLAERSFESKRRDFQRFLERFLQRFGNDDNCDQSPVERKEHEMRLQQFRRFCQNWLNVFKECSIDPVVAPKLVVDREDLEECKSVAEVAELCLNRLRLTEVRFISAQRDQDWQVLRASRHELKRWTVSPQRGSSRMLALVQPPLASVNTSSFSGSSLDIPWMQDSARRVSWLSCGSGHGWSCSSSSASQDHLPTEIRCGCGRITILSKEHMSLISAFILGFVILILELINVCNNWASWDAVASIVLVLLVQICLIVMMIRFEDIDVVQQLEREVKELARQNQAVEKQREKMHEFWSNCQNLTELWLYRTLPRLDLYKELHSQLEDAHEEDLVINMAGLNQALEALENNLGALQDWRNDGFLSPEDKKNFGKAINTLCQEPAFQGILCKLEDINRSPMLTNVQALPPSSAHPFTKF